MALSAISVLLCHLTCLSYLARPLASDVSGLIAPRRHCRVRRLGVAEAPNRLAPAWSAWAGRMIYACTAHRQGHRACGRAPQPCHPSLDRESESCQPSVTKCNPISIGETEVAMRSTWWGVAILLVTGLLLVFPSSRLQGQAVNATLLGTVTDVSGAVVPGTKVEIREVNTGSTRSIVTNESGNYVFADLPPGQYQVSVEKQGFKKEVHAAVDVLVNSTVRVDLKLEPGALSETIEVTADTPMLQTDRVDIGQKIETRQVEDLPLGFNRNFQNLLNLVPGTVRAHRDHSEFFNSQDSLSTEVNGQARQFNNLLVEGVDDNERTGLLQVYIPPAEAIQTVDVTTSNYAAEFGRAGGAVTNVVLKSGVNAFHGAAYEFNRVSALAARSFFNRPPGFFPRTTYNYYGGNLGGPIIKNRLFFFGDILRISDSRGRFNRVTVPTDAFRQGDFSAAGVNIYNPFTGNPNDGTNRQQFSYRGTANVIDPALISPIALKILEKVPHANAPGCPSPACPVTGNFQNTTRFLKNTTTFDTKL